MDDEPRASDESTSQPDELDEAFPPVNLTEFARLDDDEDDDDDLGHFGHHHEEFVLLESDDIDQARRTARAILSAMESLAVRMASSGEDKRSGTGLEDIDRHMEQLAGALGSVAELIEVYAGIIERD